MKSDDKTRVIMAEHKAGETMVKWLRPLDIFDALAPSMELSTKPRQLPSH